MWRPRVGNCLVALFVVACLSLVRARAVAQIIVDCSGNTPGAFTSINSVIPLLSDGAVMRITGACTENVNISGFDNLWIGTPVGQSMTLQGNLSINNVRNLFLHGMNITNPLGDGVSISGSRVTLDQCTSSNNAGFGMNIGGSTVNVQNTGAFDNNGKHGISATGGNTELDLATWNGPITASNNIGNGIYLEDGVLFGYGNLILSNNKQKANASPTDTATGLGITLYGHARAVLLGLSSPNLISGNQTGGVLVAEGSEISLCCSSGAQSTIVDRNGPVGITAGLGSQLTLWDGVQISNHSDAGVDVYGHSQVFINDGGNQITNNGTGILSTYPTRAGVRVDGNSEAYIRGGKISQNGGPGILALVNSSIDLSGTTLTSNLGGSIVCDSSAWLVSDFPGPATKFGPGPPCNVPNSFRPRMRALSAPQLPDISRFKAQLAIYKRLISSF